MKKKILFSLVLSLFLVGTVGAFSFSIQEERQISDYAPNIEYNHDSLYSVSGPNSQMIFENLDRNTEYTFVRYFNKTDPEDTNQTSNQSNIEEEVIGKFTTDSSRELSGDASFDYSISDYKNRKDFLYNQSGYIHAIKKDGEVVRKFGLNVGLWIDEAVKSEGESYDYNDRHTGTHRVKTLERDSLIVFDYYQRLGDSLEFLIRKNNPDGNDRTIEVTDSSNKSKTQYGLYDKVNNEFELYQYEKGNNTERELENYKSFDMSGYKNVDILVRASDSRRSTVYMGAKYLIVPRTHNMEWYPSPRSIDFPDNVSVFSQDQFGNTDIKYKDFDGDGYSSFNTINFGISKIGFKGEAPDGFRLNVHPTTYTDTDLDANPNRFDECPETEGYQFDGCPRDSGIDDLINPNNGITGQLTENPTQTGVGVGTTLLVLLGLGIYFTRIR